MPFAEPHEIEYFLKLHALWRSSDAPKEPLEALLPPVVPRVRKARPVARWKHWQRREKYLSVPDGLAERNELTIPSEHHHLCCSIPLCVSACYQCCAIRYRICRDSRFDAVLHN
jgi:hypothetical protein